MISPLSVDLDLRPSMPSESVRHPSARRVDVALESHGLIDRVRELPASTRTAADAAQALGCEVRQIVKSLVFRREPSGLPVLALVAGDHRLDEEWMLRQTGERWLREDPEQVRATAGFAIGGVPPIGHPTPLPTVVDYDLLEQREVWAAAGHPNAVCRITSTELLRVTRGRPVSVVPITGAPDPPSVWVSFDCYGTIVDWKTGLARALESQVGPMSPSDSERVFSHYLTQEQAIERGPFRPYHEVMSQAVRSAYASLGLGSSLNDPERIPSSIPEWPLFSDSAEALDRLRGSGLKIAILSNIDRDLLDRTIRQHGLPVDLSVAADEVRSYKPELAHWIRFLKMTGISPETGRHVSAGYDYDIPPAAMLGFRTVYIGRYGPGPTASVATAAYDDLLGFASSASESKGEPDGPDGMV